MGHSCLAQEDLRPSRITEPFPEQYILTMLNQQFGHSMLGTRIESWATGNRAMFTHNNDNES